MYWEAINEVPDTPGESSSVNLEVLTVIGTDDQDYRWQDISTLPYVNGLRREITDNETSIEALRDLQSITVATSQKPKHTQHCLLYTSPSPRDS